MIHNKPITNIQIPKGTEIIFSGHDGRKYKGILKSSKSAWQLHRPENLTFASTPVIIPERRKRIAVGYYVLCNGEDILKVSSGYRLENNNSVFTGIKMYQKWDDCLWRSCASQEVHYNPSRWHHSNIETVFKTKDDLDEFLMLENL
tara:strand:- start:737 stop:1174 length:438 start_codon:yes stop_codon:yes gene_type:complete